MTELDHPRHADLREQCRVLGITITQCGMAWKLEGRGVRIIVARLGDVLPSDLQPTRHPRTPRRR